MRILLDTSALNWFADHPDAARVLLGARGAGSLQVLVPLEVAKEVRDTTNPQRLAKLESFLSAFVPLTPTRVPRLGAFRLGLGQRPTTQDVDRLAALRFLRDGQDRNMATNAAGYRCDVFVTCDREMVEKKRLALERVLDGTRVLRPVELVTELENNDHRHETHLRD